MKLINDLIKLIYMSEAVPMRLVRDYMKLAKEHNYKERYKDWFGNKYRIYVPLHDPVPQEIKDALEEQGYEVVDYINNKAKRIGYTGQNTTAIGKILNKIGDKELLKMFNERGKGTKIEDKKEEDDYLVVISRHPYDVIGMTTGRCWYGESCMNLTTGLYAHKVLEDIKEGTLVAYVIKEDDKNIKNPLSRVLMKPYIHEKTGKIYLIRADKKYGETILGFFEAVNAWLNKVQGKIPAGNYDIKENLYADGKYTHHVEGILSFEEFNERLTEKVDRKVYAKIKKYSYWILNSESEYSMRKIEFDPKSNNIKCYGVIWKGGKWDGGWWMDGDWVSGEWIEGYDAKGLEHRRFDSPKEWPIIMDYKKFKQRIGNASEELYNTLIDDPNLYSILDEKSDYYMDKIIYRKKEGDALDLECYGVVWRKGTWRGWRWMSGEWVGGLWLGGVDKYDIGYAPGDSPARWGFLIEYDEFENRIEGMSERDILEVYEGLRERNSFRWILYPQTKYKIDEIKIDRLNSSIYCWGVTWMSGEWIDGVWMSGEWIDGIWKGGSDKYGISYARGDSPASWSDLISFEEFKERIDISYMIFYDDTYKNLRRDEITRWVLNKETDYDVKSIEISSYRGMRLLRFSDVVWRKGIWRGGQWISGTWEGGKWIEGYNGVYQLKYNPPNTWKDIIEYKEFGRRIGRIEGNTPSLEDYSRLFNYVPWLYSSNSKYHIDAIEEGQVAEELDHIYSFYGVEWRDGKWVGGQWMSGEWIDGEWVSGYDIDGTPHGWGDSPDLWDLTRNIIDYNEFKKRIESASEEMYEILRRNNNFRGLLLKNTDYTMGSIKIDSRANNFIGYDIRWKKGIWPKNGTWYDGEWLGGTWRGGRDILGVYRNVPPNRWPYISLVEFRKRVDESNMDIRDLYIRLLLLGRDVNFLLDVFSKYHMKRVILIEEDPARVECYGVVWNKGVWRGNAYWMSGEFINGMWGSGYDKNGNFQIDPPYTWNLK